MTLKLFLGIWLSLVIIAGISFPITENPTNWYDLPFVPGLEDKARIIFFHVPMAWVATLAFGISLIYGIKYLSKENLDYDIKSVSSAGLGLIFAILATVTGSLWAKFSWGSFWNWDPRQTSIFVLLLIYGAYFALRSAIEGDEKRATLSAVYAIIAGVTAPFFIFIMPRLVEGLHPNEAFVSQGKISMNPTMLVIFLCSLSGFTALYFWMLNTKVRLERLELKHHLKGD
ncbi:MAG: cytochrome c biogenesis protein CcsA [Ignavibacteriales bacterium]|nr:cytochrome c biogenesis protein CcsA [Ignavibacteriales bacterium]